MQYEECQETWSARLGNSIRLDFISVLKGKRCFYKLWKVFKRIFENSKRKIVENLKTCSTSSSSGGSGPPFSLFGRSNMWEFIKGSWYAYCVHWHIIQKLREAVRRWKVLEDAGESDSGRSQHDLLNVIDNVIATLTLWRHHDYQSGHTDRRSGVKSLQWRLSPFHLFGTLELWSLFKREIWEFLE